MENSQWTDAIAALELGLKNRDVFGEPELVVELEQELARANGRKLYADGVASLSNNRYEDALAAVQDGLAEQTGDAELTGLLNAVRAYTLLLGQTLAI